MGFQMISFTTFTGTFHVSLFSYGLLERTSPFSANILPVLVRSTAQTIQNKSPNPFQMLRFLYSADVALADLPLCFYTAPVLNFIVGKSSLSPSSSTTLLV